MSSIVDLDQWGDGTSELYICDLCGAGFLTFVGQEVHLLEHHDLIVEVPRHAFPCATCGKTFETRMGTNRHAAYVHKDRFQYRKQNARFYRKDRAK